MYNTYLKKSVSDHAENEIPASSLESSGRVLRLHTYVEATLDSHLKM